jgi:hypothetical protein
MATYTYKGINIETITDVTDANVNSDVTNYFPQFKTKLTNYNGEKPLELPFFISGTSISNKCKANMNTINNSQTINIPSGVNKIRAIIVGAGGGNGGDGVGGSVNVNSGGNKTVSGGNGGIGGTGGIYYYDSSTITQSYLSSISITCGSGGTKGNNGSGGGNVNTPLGTRASKGGNSGGKGNDGGGSSITISDTTYTANGGIGGNGGEGATAVYNGGSFNSNGGGDGNKGDDGTGNTTSNTYNYSINTGSIGGDPGTNGYVQIIWLYD